MAVKRHPDGKRWIADFYYFDDKGKRRRKEKIKPTKDAAAKWSVDEERRLEAFYSSSSKQRNRDQRTIAEHIAWFKSRSGYKNAEPSTKQIYDRRLEVLRQWAEQRGIVTLKQFFNPQEESDRHTQPEAYYHYLCETYSTDTAGSFLQIAIMATNAELRRQDRYWTESPWSSIERKKRDPKEVRWFTREELTALRKEMTELELHTFDLLLNTGMRTGEAKNLTWQQFVDDHIKILPHDGWKPKHGKRRNIPLNGRAKECIEFFQSLLGPKYILWNEAAKGLVPVGRNFLHNHFKRIKSRASKEGGLTFEGAVVHTFRATCGSMMLQNGVPIAFVSSFLGHADIQTTQRHYASLAQENLEFAAERLQEAFKKMET